MSCSAIPANTQSEIMWRRDVNCSPREGRDGAIERKQIACFVTSESEDGIGRSKLSSVEFEIRDK